MRRSRGARVAREFGRGVPRMLASQKCRLEIELRGRRVDRLAATQPHLWLIGALSSQSDGAWHDHVGSCPRNLAALWIRRSPPKLGGMGLLDSPVQRFQ